ncbi:MAG: hypothetical protein K9L30_09075 [Desulfobacterales bacterium]|nr:hypothetical protein [Desulfobacterales bacterium]
MSIEHPECPLFRAQNCKDYYCNNICALVRKDKVCQKKAKAKNKNKYVAIR